MNKKLASVAFYAGKINRQHVQILMALVALAMLVLGVGAPSDGGGSGHRM
jgi:hypothetical protein